MSADASTLADVFKGMLRAETDEYIHASLEVVKQVAGVPVAWMTMHGLSFEAYAYSEGDAAKIATALLNLGAHEARPVPRHNWRDGDYWTVRGSM